MHVAIYWMQFNKDTLYSHIFLIGKILGTHEIFNYRFSEYYVESFYNII